MMSLKKKIILVATVFGFSLGFYALIVEPQRITIKEYTVTTKKWPHGQSLKIALIADVHAIWPWMSVDHIQRIVKKANQQDPDLIFLLGDYVATHPFGIQIPPKKGVAPYQDLSAPCGVYAVLGNHDLHGDGSDGWSEAIRKNTFPVLENKAEEVTCRNIPFWIAGLEDVWWQNADVKKTLSQITDENPVIMMMHNPDSFVDVPNRVALSVAGHTHRGQIRFPFVGAIKSVIPSKFGKRFLYGHIHEDGKDLIVSGGLGTTGLPLRFLAPPEIAIITLKSNQNN